MSTETHWMDTLSRPVSRDVASLPSFGLSRKRATYLFSFPVNCQLALACRAQRVTGRPQSRRTDFPEWVTVKSCSQLFCSFNMLNLNSRLLDQHTHASDHRQKWVWIGFFVFFNGRCFFSPVTVGPRAMLANRVFSPGRWKQWNHVYRKVLH